MIKSTFLISNLRLSLIVLGSSKFFIIILLNVIYVLFLVTAVHVQWLCQGFEVPDK